MTSPLSPAWPRTLTLPAMTVAGPGRRGTLLKSASASFFLTVAGLAVFFFGDFFFTGFAAAALVFSESDALVSAGAAAGVSTAAGDWASSAVESTAQKNVQQVFFITQPSRDLISGSVNVRHLPGRSS